MSRLLRIIADPTSITGLQPQCWNQLIREVRALRVEARLSYLLEDRHLLDACPGDVRLELEAQRYQPELIRAQTRLELRKVIKALTPVQTPLLLLKGAGYMAADLPLARGRSFSDLDVLVPRDRLDAVEAALVRAGWVAYNTDDYDQAYYRRWMHELPPMYHPSRGMLIDVHHRILPQTSRLQPNPALLWEKSAALPESTLRILSPQDMVLHSAAHLFHDGEISGAFGNLLDLHELLTDFGRDPGFHAQLPDRAVELGLARPLYYAVTFCRSLLGTQLPHSLIERCRAFAPVLPADLAMRVLVPPAIGPRHPYKRPAAFAAWLLYLRSHWLRMPPALLAEHLTRKGLRRAQLQR